jgi:Rrf2 family transcriptional regulator, iron-sulfur cluster assembly transcription factor
MLLSKSCMYGLRASVLLASRNNAEFITIRELSDELNISFYFLTKVLQQMTKANLLESYKGPNGGVKLARPAGEIRFMDVVIAIDGLKSLNECALGLPGCGVMKPCPLHDQWSALKTDMMNMMESITLKQLSIHERSTKVSDQTIDIKSRINTFFEPN